MLWFAGFCQRQRPATTQFLVAKGMLWALTSWVMDWLRHNKFSWRVAKTIFSYCSKTCKHMLKVPFLFQNCCHTTWTLESYVLLVEQASLCRKDEFKGLVVIHDALQARSWRLLGIGRCVFCLEGFLVDAMSFSGSVPITMPCFKFMYSIWYDKDIQCWEDFPCILSFYL